MDSKAFFGLKGLSLIEPELNPGFGIQDPRLNNLKKRISELHKPQEILSLTLNPSNRTGWSKTQMVRFQVSIAYGS